MRGSLSKVRDGVYRLRWDGAPDPATGRRRQQSRTIRGTRKQAEQALNRLVGDPDNAAPDNHTLDELVTAWLEAVEADLSPRTVANRRGTYQRHIAPALGAMQLRQIRAHHLDDLYGRLRKDGKTATALAAHSLLHGAFAQAVKWDWLAANPAAKATPPKQPRTKVTVPDTADVAKILAVCAAWADTGLDVLVRLGAVTGMRRGELCALTWRDVDLDEGAIHVHRAVIAIKGGTHVKTTKTDTERTVAIPAVAVAMLRDWHTRSAARLAAVHPERCGLSPAGYVFPGRLGGNKPLHPDSVSSRWALARRAAGVTGIRLHDLRHLSASQLVAAGVDMRTVLERHGWTNLQTAMRYVHAVDEKDRAAAESLAGVFGGLDVGDPVLPSS